MACALFQEGHCNRNMSQVTCSVEWGVCSQTPCAEPFLFRRVHKITPFIGKLGKFCQSLKVCFAGVVWLRVGVVYAGTSGVIHRRPTVQKPLGRGSWRFGVDRIGRRLDDTTLRVKQLLTMTTIKLFVFGRERNIATYYQIW